MPSNPIVLENITFPEPVISVAIEPKTTADQDKMAEALHKLSEEDPTFRVRVDEETGQTIISGMGELHLEILVDRMLREFRVQAELDARRLHIANRSPDRLKKLNTAISSKPAVMANMAMWSWTSSPVSRAAGSFLKMILLVVLSRRNTSRQLKRVCVKRRKRVCWRVIRSSDIKVRLYDGSFHEVDSSEMAFKMAASMAFKEGMHKGGPVLLEPIMKVEVVVPEEFLGDIIGQLNARRGEIQGMEMRPGNAQAVTCDGSPGGDVWLCHRFAFCNPGTRCFHNGI